MSTKLIALSIDVTKIDKDRLFVGKKGTYLNLMVEVRDEPDRFGNHASAWEGQTKEERQAKADRTFLGDGKVVWEGESRASNETTTQSESSSQQPVKDDNDDLPF